MFFRFFSWDEKSQGAWAAFSDGRGRGPFRQGSPADGQRTYGVRKLYLFWIGDRRVPVGAGKRTFGDGSRTNSAGPFGRAGMGRAGRHGGTCHGRPTSLHPGPGYASLAMGRLLSQSVPVLAACFGWWILGEPLTPHFILGTLLVLAACSLLGYQEKRALARVE